MNQEDVFSKIEPLMHGLFTEFAPAGYSVSPAPFIRIPYAEAILKYGSDKPDLRNPIEICDVTNIFVGSDFSIFTKSIADGAVVKQFQRQSCC